ncbi:hypothetical protein EPVG_00435 [Emiliania huxleyi virus 201]|uniref:DNA-directed RNA polymerase RBP11-like dimerisation domain-containing protein n=1 Tax=viral metagenome TaxID=1070528 RepID=A0A6C0LSS6_9ZZZZ|nr:hypothetical protein ELVG_00419 [Emiliania huxleyi virus 203]AEP15397.1 hypothetical protein EOVG_00460 [Emiliania huxleyi virus 88]AEP15805.1 hypothetical protein EQVG_00396 [Emiliania huxleyi virus 207]AEP16192.1 hypothetical protein ERVG_00317 [Emiliania huxleyi virus 208]AET98322.1 hypothetical protein EPVG_00435 [Emiliania huxleyi virus 201]
MKVYTINGDAHTLANIVSSELVFNNKDASYRVPHPNSRTSQLVLHDGCSNKDLESTCTNLQGILSEMRHELAVKFADDLIHTDEKIFDTLDISYQTANSSIVTDGDIC